MKRLMDADPLPHLLRPLSQLAINNLKSAEETAHSIGHQVDLAFAWQFFPIRLHEMFTIRPFQIRSELVEFLTLLQKSPRRNIMEIGTARGGTLYLLAKVAAPEATILSVDLPYGGFGGGYPKWKIPFYESFADKAKTIHVIRDDSHDPKVRKHVKEILQEEKLDLLFIDGDHSYDGVRKDFEMFGPLVGRSGLVAFHDIAIHPPETHCEVSQFWNQIKNSYEHLEIIESASQDWGGIGILFLEND